MFMSVASDPMLTTVVPRICQKYEEITETVRSTPDTTEELVTLNQYIKRTKEVTIHKLIDEIDEATYRLSFLLDYATLPCMWDISILFIRFQNIIRNCWYIYLFSFVPADDLRLNSRVFLWPNQILIELEDSTIRLATLREQAEDYLQKRLQDKHFSHLWSHPRESTTHECIV